MMEISQEGIEFIQRLELPKGQLLKKHLTPYDDGAGLPTIGFGHLLPDWEHDPITEVEAHELFREDLRIPQRILDRDREIAQHQYDALCSFIFNIGHGNWNQSKSRAYLVQGTLNYIPVLFFEYTRSGKKRLEGLMNRRLKEMKLFYLGKYS